METECQNNGHSGERSENDIVGCGYIEPEQYDWDRNFHDSGNGFGFDEE